MRSPLFATAIGAVRLWARLYTWRMEPALGAARRAEIESDLWAFERDEVVLPPLSPAIHVFVRFLRGIPDDLGWRVEHDDLGDDLLRSRFVVTAAVALIVATFWTLPWFGQGPPSRRLNVLNCARASAPAQTADEFRLQIVTCAGAFFKPE